MDGMFIFGCVNLNLTEIIVMTKIDRRKTGEKGAQRGKFKLQASETTYLIRPIIVVKTREGIKNQSFFNLDGHAEPLSSRVLSNL